MNIFNTFGLCGQDASSFASTERNRFDEVMAEIQECLTRLVEIIQQEVPDGEMKHQIFGRMSAVARDIGSLERRKNKQDEDLNEYRLYT